MLVTTSYVNEQAYREVRDDGHGARRGTQLSAGLDGGGDRARGDQHKRYQYPGSTPHTDWRAHPRHWEWHCAAGQAPNTPESYADLVFSRQGEGVQARHTGDIPVTRGPANAPKQSYVIEFARRERIGVRIATKGHQMSNELAQDAVEELAIYDLAASVLSSKGEEDLLGPALILLANRNCTPKCAVSTRLHRLRHRDFGPLD